jgi:hypothetical protein
MKAPIVPGRLKLKQPGKKPSHQPQIAVRADTKTKAEAAFLEAQRCRQPERIGAHLQVTHKERMEKYNQLLGSLPEHFDLPKSSSG